MFVPWPVQFGWEEHYQGEIRRRSKARYWGSQTVPLKKKDLGENS